MGDKAKIREFYLAERRKIKNVTELSTLVSSNVADFLVSHGRGKTWASYRSLGHEVDLSRLNLKNNFAYPKITTSKEMGFYKASLVNNEWLRGEFGFLEPKNSDLRLEVRSLEGVLFPGVAYDYFGNRIGYGRGFYDKTFIDYFGIKVGICFSQQVSKELFTCVTKKDVSVNYIITEKGCFEVKQP